MPIGQPSLAANLPDLGERQHFRLREFELADRVFVVTGGGQGLGLTISEALVEAGGQGMYARDFYITKSSLEAIERQFL